MYVPLWLNCINQRRGLTILVDTRQLLGPVFGRTRLMTTDPVGHLARGRWRPWAGPAASHACLVHWGCDVTPHPVAPLARRAAAAPGRCAWPWRGERLPAPTEFD